MNRPTPDLTEQVAALAAEIEQLRQLFDQHRADAERAQESANSAHRVLRRLGEQVAALAQSTGDEQPRTPPPVSWLAVDDPRTAVETMANLVDWLDTVYLLYPDAAESLGECWWLHPHVVEELLALYGAWRDAYTGRGASSTRALVWHDQHRPAALHRIAKTTGNCSRIAHQPGHRADQAPPHAPLPDDGIDQAASAWAARRESGVTTPAATHSGGEPA